MCIIQNMFKFSRQTLRTEKGFSIVEALIAGAIVMITFMAFSQLLFSNQKEVKKLTQKLALQDLNVTLKNILQDQSRCAFNFSMIPSFNSNLIPNTGVYNPALISIPRIYRGATATSDIFIEVGQPLQGTSGVSISTIELKDWRKDSVDTFSATLAVGVTTDTGAIQPVQITNVFIQTNPTSPAHAKQLSACSTAGTSGGAAAQATTVGYWFPSYTMPTGGIWTIPAIMGLPICGALGANNYFNTKAAFSTVKHYQSRPCSPISSTLCRAEFTKDGISATQVKYPDIGFGPQQKISDWWPVFCSETQHNKNLEPVSEVGGI